MAYFVLIDLCVKCFKVYITTFLSSVALAQPSGSGLAAGPTSPPAFPQDNSPRPSLFSQVITNKLPLWMHALVTGYFGYKVVDSYSGRVKYVDPDNPEFKTPYRILQRDLQSEISRTQAYLNRQKQALHPGGVPQNEGPTVVSAVKFLLNPKSPSSDLGAVPFTSASPAAVVSEDHVARLLRLAQSPDYQTVVIDDHTTGEMRRFSMRTARSHLDHAVNPEELQGLKRFLVEKIGSQNSIAVTFENYSTDRFAQSGLPRLTTNVHNVGEVEHRLDIVQKRSRYLRRQHLTRRYQALGALVFGNLLIIGYQYREQIYGAGQDFFQALQAPNDEPNSTQRNLDTATVDRYPRARPPTIQVPPPPISPNQTYSGETDAPGTRNSETQPNEDPDFDSQTDPAQGGELPILRPHDGAG
jgi:hypothetical protein